MIVHILDTSPEELRMRTRYALETGLSTAGLSHRFIPEVSGTERAVLCYGKSDSETSDTFCRTGGIWIQMSRCDRLYDPDAAPGPLRYLRWHSPPIPLWGEGAPELSFERIGRGVRCTLSADLFGNLFLHISRMEELHAPALDRFGRFRSQDSLLGKAGLLDLPVVDGYVNMLIRILVECCRLKDMVALRTAFWPAGERFAAFLSHDVDRIVKWTPKRVGYELWGALRMIGSEEGRNRFRRMFLSMLRRENPYWNFDTLMELEERAGVRSSFYFGVGGAARGDPADCTSDERIRRVVDKLREEGWETGFHGSHRSYKSSDLLERERNKFEGAFGFTPSGVRQHFLRLDFPETLRMHAHLGFEYDATLGYSDREGFRSGISFPFFPFDPDEARAMDLLELPLSLMDRTLEARGYDERVASRVLRTYLDLAVKYGGLFSLLVHQSALDEQEHPYIGLLYRSLLEDVGQRDVYCRTGEEIARWWRRRASLDITEEGEQRVGQTFRIVSHMEVPDACLLLEPLPHPERWQIDVEGCDCARRDVDDSVRLHLRAVKAGEAVAVHITGRG